MSHIQTFLLTLAQKVGNEILAIYNDSKYLQSIENKGDNSPLTLADKRSNECICAALQAEYPDIPILSEEGKAITYAERKNWQRFWLIDPLDGTKEFIKRNGEFTVHIALIENGIPILGLVHAPVKNISYIAEKSKGATKWENGQTTVLQCVPFSTQQKDLRIVASRSHLSPETETYIAQFSHTSTLSMGSSLKFMLIAEGKADIYPRLGSTMEWDVAAPQIIVEEAGGSVLHYETGKPLSYNKENLLSPWFIVKGKEI
jgi:3'(2'), 5'-bisphosphate nucleotidase